MPSGALHSAATPRWGTPADLVERSRRALGDIDLDPCSEAAFEPVVRAARSYSLVDRGEDGLALPWSGRVFVNPPGGLVREFWRRLLSEPVTSAVWIGFSVEQLCLLADEPLHPADFSICYLRQRARFTRHDGYSGSPSHGNYAVGIAIDHAAFAHEFAPLGRVFAGPAAQNAGILPTGGKL